MKICIGGTFNVLHRGHKKLLEEAFKKAGNEGFVFIGLTKQKIQDSNKKTRKYEEREKDLIKFLEEHNWLSKSKILPITDKYGLAVDENYDAIVVSPETYHVAEEINEKRIQNGRKPLRIFRVPFVLAEDGKPISSSRIKNREINENGKILKD